MSKVKPVLDTRKIDPSDLLLLPEFIDQTPNLTASTAYAHSYKPEFPAPVRVFPSGQKLYQRSDLIAYFAKRREKILASLP